MTQQIVKSKKKNVETKDFSASSFKLQASRNSGFTFVELIIVISIFAVLSSVVMFNFTDFSSNVKLQNLVQDVALQIRQAQLSGSSGRTPPQVNSIIPGGYATGLKPSFGVHFNTAAPDGFVYFTDFLIDDQGIFGTFNSADTFDDPIDQFLCDPVSQFDDECIDVLIFPPEFTISKIEVFEGGNTFSTPDDFNTLDITFTRPKLEASFIVDNGSIGTIISAKITLRSSRGQERVVSVSRIGQISAQ
jgi:prepilin-type N-terminal cleavage/methylation domain-containing protein